MTAFSGTWPALVTPFTADDGIHTATISRLVKYHLDKGVNGFYVCGSTGSGVFLSVTERKQVVEAALAEVGGQVPVLVHVGAVSLSDAIDLACHAQANGAAGFSSIIPPLYTTLDVVSAYYRRLAQAVPDLPFFPYLTNPTYSAVELLQRLEDLPNLSGAKYTGANMYEFGHVAAMRNGDWYVFSGMDEQAIFAAMSGSCGHIGSTLNYMPGVYKHIRQRVEAGEHGAAMTLQQRANTVTRVLHSVNFGGGLYAVLEMLGFECGHPRLPHAPLSADVKADFCARLESADFWALAEMN